METMKDILIISQDRYHKITEKTGIRNIPFFLLDILPYFPDLSLEKLYYSNKGNITFNHTINQQEKYKYIILINRVIRSRRKKEKIVKKLKNLTSNLIFFDLGDSVGSLQKYVFPIIDEYWKKQIYKDKTYYNRDYPHNKIYADILGNFNKEKTRKLSKKQLQKIKPAWNIGLSDHYLYSNDLQKILRRFGLTNLAPPNIVNPAKKRKYDVNKRLRTSYINKITEKHREMCLEKLSSAFKTTPTKKIDKKLYLQELGQSKIVLSPYGYGEICYRDFEAIIKGATLIKPDMSHIKTWPDIYKNNETYVPVKWDFSDLNKKIDYLLKNPGERMRIAKNAQEKYKDYYGKEGTKKLQKRFENLLS